MNNLIKLNFRIAIKWIVFKHNIQCCAKRIRKIFLNIKWFLKCWFWWTPKRATKELWKYGFILSWDERINKCGILPRRWAKWLSDFSRWRYNRSIGYTKCMKDYSWVAPPIEKTQKQTEPFKRPKNSASIVTGEIRICIHNITTDEIEHKRITKILTKLEKQIANKKGKLNNEQFITNAKKEIVTSERNLLNNLLLEQQSLSELLDELNNSEKES